MAEQECESLFRDHPDYLFARLGVVENLLKTSDADKAESILFEKGRDLREIYPDRTVFHVTEVRSWFASCCKLFAMKLNVEEARHYLDLLEEMEPESEIAEMLHDLLSRDAQASFAVLSRLRNGFKGRQKGNPEF